MPLSFEERTVRNKSCPSCGADFQHVTGFINDEGRAYALYFAACHGHPEHEAQIDVVLGSWGMEPPVHDFVTFSCRLRSDSAMAADAALATTSDDPILGQRLSRAEALEHPKLQEFWGVVDFLAESDPTVNSSVYGSFPPKPGGGRLGQVRRLFRSGGRGSQSTYCSGITTKSSGNFSLWLGSGKTLTRLTSFELRSAYCRATSSYSSGHSQPANRPMKSWNGVPS